ncbi:hypothetical protein [Dapis sp. BLCC M172]
MQSHFVNAISNQPREEKNFPFNPSSDFQEEVIINGVALSRDDFEMYPTI